MGAETLAAHRTHRRHKISLPQHRTLTSVIAANTHKDSVISRMGMTKIRTNPLILDDGNQLRVTVRAEVAHASAVGEISPDGHYAGVDSGLRTMRDGRDRVGTPRYRARGLVSVCR